MEVVGDGLKVFMMVFAGLISDLVAESFASVKITLVLRTLGCNEGSPLSSYENDGFVRQPGPKSSSEGAFGDILISCRKENILNVQPSILH